MTDPGQLDQTVRGSSESPHEAHEAHEAHQRWQDGLVQSARRFLLSGNRMAWRRIILSLIALTAASAALIAIVSSGGSRQASSSSSANRPGPGTIPASSAPSSAVGPAKSNIPSTAKVAENAGALMVPASMRRRVMTWQFGRGGTRLAAVSSLYGIALQERALRQYPQMKSTCVQLARSVRAAQGGPPIPVAAMQTLYGKALAELAQGAADCQAAIRVRPGDESVTFHLNAVLLSQSVSDLAAGSRDIFGSTAEIEIMSRQSH